MMNIELAVAALCVSDVTDCLYLDYYWALNIMLQPDLIMCLP